MSWNLIPDADLKRISDGMEQAECAGLFDGLFSGVCKELRQLPTKEGLLEEIRPDMKLYRSFFMRIYGYEISYPGFADKALSRLEVAGCGRARQYYERFVLGYEWQQADSIKLVAEWYRKQVDENYDKKCKEYQKEGGIPWIQNHNAQWMEGLY